MLEAMRHVVREQAGDLMGHALDPNELRSGVL
jgi:hypothetical protein